MQVIPSLREDKLTPMTWELILIQANLKLTLVQNRKYSLVLLRMDVLFTDVVITVIRINIVPRHDNVPHHLHG